MALLTEGHPAWWCCSPLTYSRVLVCGHDYNCRERRPFPDQPWLAADLVHVVSCPLDECPAGALDVLDDVERRRAARFVFDRDRRRYITAHAHLRSVLGRCLGRPPMSLRLASTPSGKPHLVDCDNPQNLRFNMTHSGDRALVAVTIGREVGVDIEEARPIGDLMAVARRFFAAGEVATIAGLPPAARPAAFFRCWTRKEAFVKAVGEGLGHPLDSFEVSLEADASCLVRQSSPRDAGWRVLPVPVEGPYAAALAAEDGDWRIQLWHAPAGSSAHDQGPATTGQSAAPPS